MSMHDIEVNNLNDLIINPEQNDDEMVIEFNSLNISNTVENNDSQDNSEYLTENKSKKVYAVKEVLQKVNGNTYKIKWSDNSISNCKKEDISPYTISLFNIMKTHNDSIKSPISKRAFIYIRESRKTATQFTQSTSRNTQLNLCLEFCKENNMHIQYIGEDIGKSGRNMKNLKSGELGVYQKYVDENNVIIINSIDRLGRHAGKALCFLDDMMKRNIDVYFVKEKLLYNSNTTNLKKTALCNILVNAESYSNEESEKIKNNIKLRRSQGHYIGGVAYGYKIVKVNGIRKKQIDKEKHKIIRDVFIRFKYELSNSKKRNRTKIYTKISELFIQKDSKLTKSLIKRIIEKKLKGEDYVSIKN